MRARPPSCSRVHPDSAPAADVLTAIEFDGSGEQLAAGDRGGRVVLFERVERAPDSVRGCGGRGVGAAPARQLRCSACSAAAPSQRLFATRQPLRWSRRSLAPPPPSPLLLPATAAAAALIPPPAQTSREGPGPSDAEFRYLTEFQSHEPEARARLFPSCAPGVQDADAGAPPPPPPV